MRLNEMDIAQRSRYISTVYQNPKTQFYCVESTDELAFPLENRNLPKDEMVKIIKKYTELLDTEKLLNRNIFSLSGGEKQRIGIARAFLHDAPFLLLDEPTSNLDSLNEGIILKSLRESCDKKTVVLVSHRQSTMQVADEVYEMENGRIS